jgi:hypothetical protein
LNPGIENTFFSFIFKNPESLLLNGYKDFSQGYSGWSGCDVHHSSPTSTKVKNEWSYISTQPNAFTVWRGVSSPLSVVSTINKTRINF